MTRAELEELDKIVIATLGREKATDWWMTPNPMFGDWTPVEMSAWNPKKLAVFIRGAWAEHG